MTIQKNRLNSCEQGIAPVQMTPAGLNHSDLGISKEMNGAFEQVFFRHKIGVEDAKKFALRRIKSDCESTSFKTGPIGPMDPLDVETALAQFLRACRGNLARFIRGIVQYLDF